MTVWFQEAYYAFAFFGLLAALLLAPWVHLQYRRFGRFRGWPAVVSALVVLYGCSLLAFTMFPTPRETPGYCASHAGRSYWQLTPFASLDDVVAYSGTHAFLQTLTSGVVLQVLMNVLFFVPLGFLLRYRFGVGWWRAIAISLGVSLAIELTQGTGIWGLAECPYRLADVDDLMTNTLGGALGWLLAGRSAPDCPTRTRSRRPTASRRRCAAGASPPSSTSRCSSWSRSACWQSTSAGATRPTRARATSRC